MNAQEMQEIIAELGKRVSALEELLNCASIEQSVSDYTSGEIITLGSGMYVVGEDIPDGKYDILTTSGAGTIYVYKSFESYDNDEIWGKYFQVAAEGTRQIEKYSDMYSVSISNLRLTSGKCMVIESGLEVQLTVK